MKVKDTLALDQIFYTLPDKLENFAGVRRDSDLAQRYIRNNFPGWQYTGTAKFDNILIWCEQHFGNDFVWDWETIYFKTEAVKTAFLLRWA